MEILPLFEGTWDVSKIPLLEVDFQKISWWWKFPPGLEEIPPGFFGLAIIFHSEFGVPPASWNRNIMFICLQAA